MTSIFVCLLVGQRWVARTAAAALAAACAVVALRLCGAGSLAVFFGAIAGVAAGLAADALARGRRAR